MHQEFPQRISGGTSKIPHLRRYGKNGERAAGQACSWAARGLRERRWEGILRSVDRTVIHRTLVASSPSVAVAEPPRRQRERLAVVERREEPIPVARIRDLPGAGEHA